MAYWGFDDDFAVTWGGPGIFVPGAAGMVWHNIIVNYADNTGFKHSISNFFLSVFCECTDNAQEARLSSLRIVGEVIQIQQPGSAGKLPDLKGGGPKNV